jgi:hypothetical protein
MEVKQTTLMKSAQVLVSSPMVVTRKVWGGNRTPAGGHTQNILLSFLQTCRQDHLLCSPQP